LRDRTLLTTLTLIILIIVALADLAGFDDLTGTEQLRRENLALKSQLHAALTERDGCRVQLAPLRLKYDGDAVRAEIAQFTRDLEAAHPGFTFNLQTGTLDPKPAPEKK
jgi:hypothetical protein